MELKEIKIPDYIDSKSALVDVIDGSKQHYSILTNEKKVLIFEKLNGNYPKWCFGVFDSLEEYINTITELDWIVENISEDDLINKYTDF